LGKLRVSSFSISLDGFGAGPDQDVKNPLGAGGEDLHKWAWTTEYFQKSHGHTGGSKGVDNDFATRGFSNVGAHIMGRNMFGPVRGPWPDQKWQGWWGENPPFHHPVFVLTHHARQLINMEGGTSFHFITDGIQTALRRAREAAGEKDILVGGGVSTVREFLKAGLIDEMHVAIAPILLGSGEHLFQGLNLIKLGYKCVEHVGTENATHVILRKENY
jgi:dihydrofolate reductase